MTTRGKTRRILNLAATLITLAMLFSAGGKLKAYLLPAQSESSAPAVSGAASAEHPAEAGAASAESKAPASREQAAEEESGGTRKQIFKIVNFLIIVAAFWYLSKTTLGPFLRAREQAIREEMERSRRASEEASARLAVVEEKMKRLDEEIGALRSSAMQEAAAERARLEEMAKTDAQKIAQAAQQEIAAATKVARHDLKVYAAELAIGVAEKKIQASISPESEKGIFRSFLNDLTDRSAKGDGNPGARPSQNGDA
jgi:F-type H+-transporting ATPase subunit b